MSWQKPTKEEIDQALPHLVRREHRRYFFENLENPLWVKPLRERGVFAKPPPPRVHEGGGVSFPIWPEAKYLSRAAAENPQDVHDTLMDLDSDNLSVHRDSLEAMLHFPGQLAGSAAKKARVWLTGKYAPHLPGEYAEVAVHAAREGQFDEALGLLEDLLAVFPDPRREEAKLLLPRPHGRFDRWHYTEVLQKYVPDLVGIIGVPVLTLLCDVLDKLIEYKLRTNKPPADVSHVWRPAIEDHEQNHPHDIDDALVSAARDACIQLLETGKADCAQLVNKLSERRWFVFHRIALHLLSITDDAPSTLVREYAMKTDSFNEGHLRHEYLNLLKAHFPRLGEEDQRTIIAWLDQHPDEETLKRRARSWGEPEPSREEIETRAKYWKVRQLAPLRDVLPAEWQNKLDALETEVGKAEHPEFTSYSSGEFVGPSSPKTVEELSSMNVESLVTFLATWSPAGRHDEPSPEGLGRVLKDAVAAQPERYAPRALLFAELDPTYVRGYISGLQEAAKRGESFEWDAVLELAEWVLSQPREIPDRESEYSDLDPGWVWTRKAIADLLGTGFEKRDNELPFESRNKAWNVLRELTEDPEPTMEYESKYGGSNMDPATLSINTTRGEAMHAVVRYALWVRRHLDEDEEGRTRSFGEMPEVREVLERHLDVTHDPSLAIRSVYGQWFPWLNLLDPEWTKGHLANIFPQDPKSATLRSAAWDTYVHYTPAYNDVLPVLLDEYDRSIGLLPDDGESPESDTKLVDHIMLYYGRDVLDLDWVMNRFFARAPVHARARAINFIGWSLKRENIKVPEDILARFRTLWEHRWEAGRQEDATSSEKELVEFGWWFSSGMMGDAWSLQELQKVLERYGRIEPDFAVFEKLAELAASHPERVLECAGLLIEGWKDPMGFYSAKPHLRSILQAAVKSSSEQTRNRTRELVNKLGEMGHLEFRDLLPD